MTNFLSTQILLVDFIAVASLAFLTLNQNARQALNIADKGYVLVQGRNRFTDTEEALLANPEVRKSFLGG